MTKYKRIGYALSMTALLVGAGVFAPVVWADGECVASNIDELEACLAGDATSVATTGTIMVTGENVDKTLVINKNITGADGYDVFHVEDGAKLTLRGNGMITAKRYGACVDGAELVIDGVAISATNPTSYGVYALNNGRVTMESGQVVADYAAFAGNNTTGDMNFYVNGGLLKSNRYPAVYMPGQVDLRVRGGTLDGGIVARMGQIEIEGGTINKQANPVAGDGLDANYSSMPSMADEAITLVAGSYKSANAEHGNDMNVRITDGNVRINGDIVLYDLGRIAEGFEQNVNVTIEGGRLTGFKTKFTEEEIGFALKNGYTAGLNNEAGRINVEISGGQYTTAPAEEDLIPGYEAELDENENIYVILPKQVDWSDPEHNYIWDDAVDEGHLPVTIEFGSELIADRKAILSATQADTNELDLDETKGGELIGAVIINLLDRDNTRIEVNDVDMTVYIDIDEELYNQLAAYDKIEVVYFDDEGKEVERMDAKLRSVDDSWVDQETGEIETWTYYWIEFNTTHLSAYGVVGVNEEITDEADGAADAATPDTGTVTVAGASAMSASLVTAIVVGVLASAMSFAYLIRKQ